MPKGPLKYYWVSLRMVFSNWHLPSCRPWRGGGNLVALRMWIRVCFKRRQHKPRSDIHIGVDRICVFIVCTRHLSSKPGRAFLISTIAVGGGCYSRVFNYNNNNFLGVMHVWPFGESSTVIIEIRTRCCQTCFIGVLNEHHPENCSVFNCPIFIIPSYILV